MKNYTAKEGYTLIELLVTVALFAVVMASALSILAVTIKNNYKAEKVMRIRRLGDYATNIIHRTVALANAIDTSNTDTDTLVFTQANGKTYTIDCNAASEKLSIVDEDAVETVLVDGGPTGDDTTDIKSCSFDAACVNTRHCRFSITLELDEDTSETFTTSTTYRNEIFNN